VVSDSLDRGPREFEVDDRTPDRPSGRVAIVDRIDLERAEGQVVGLSFKKQSAQPVDQQVLNRWRRDLDLDPVHPRQVADPKYQIKHGEGGALEHLTERRPVHNDPGVGRVG